MKERKILIVVSRLKKSGPLNVIENILKWLDGYEVTIATLSDSPSEDYKEYLPTVVAGLRIVEFSIPNINLIWPTKQLFSKYIDLDAYDIIHTHGIRPDYVFSLLNVDSKHVTTIHSFPYEDYKLSFGPIKGLVMATAHRLIMNRMTNVVFCSNSIENRIRIRSSNKTTIFNGIDTSEFKVGQGEGEQLGVYRRKYTFISVGHISSKKNPILIVEAFNEVRTMYPDLDLTLIMLGDGDLRNILIERGFPGISFPGKVSNVYDFLATADAFISASYSEGTPNAVLEALGCGLPVLLSDISSHRSIKQIVGDQCHIFGQKEELVSMMAREVRHGRRERMVSDRFHAVFSAESMADSYANYFDDIIKKNQQVT